MSDDTRQDATRATAATATLPRGGGAPPTNPAPGRLAWPRLDLDQLGPAVTVGGAGDAGRAGTVRSRARTAAAAVARWYRAGQLGPDSSVELARWTGARC